MIKRLLAHPGININIKCGNECTPLMWAVKRGRLENVKVMVEAFGVDMATRDMEDDHLITVARYKSSEWVSLIKLLSAGIVTW